MSDWRSIKTAPRSESDNQAVAEFTVEHVDLWLTVPASPSSFGMSDAWRVIDCWQTSDGKWWHRDNSEVKELYGSYVTHWMSIPKPPKRRAA